MIDGNEKTKGVIAIAEAVMQFGDLFALSVPACSNVGDASRNPISCAIAPSFF